MTTDHIRYDILAQNALRGVVRQVLSDASREGLKGDHHFYISLKTHHPGVRISNRLIEKFPEEITVVLQHQFWDLTVTETGFEVGMSFSGAPEKLVVPFEAITGFFDPSVQFGLKFEVVAEEEAPALTSSKQGKTKGGRALSKAESSEVRNGTPKGLKIVAEKSDTADKEPASGEKIISLDTFRKKK